MIQFGNNEMDRGAVDTYPGRQGLAMGMEAFESRQQRRVNVEHAPVIVSHQVLGEYAHESRQQNKIRLVAGQGLGKLLIEEQAIGVGCRVHDIHCNTGLKCDGQTGCMLSTADDGYDPRGPVLQSCRIDQGLQVRAPTRDENDDGFHRAQFSIAPPDLPAGKPLDRL